MRHVLSFALLVTAQLDALLAMIPMLQEIIVTVTLATIEITVPALSVLMHSVQNAIVQELALNARRMQDQLLAVIAYKDTTKTDQAAPRALIPSAKTVTIQVFAIPAKPTQDLLLTVIV